jgi:hypothetical protein
VRRRGVEDDSLAAAQIVAEKRESARASSAIRATIDAASASSG